MKQIPPIIKMQRGKYSRSQVLILGIYFLLALAMTYPLITNLCAVPASSGDKYQFIWNIWWINKCLLEGKNVFNIDYLFYPHAFSGVFHTFALTPVLLTVPAYHLLGVIANYNLIILLGFWLSAFFCYQLVCYLTDSTRAGFIAGIIYGFNPIHTRAAYEGGYLNFAFDALVPLFVLAFITFFDKRRVKYIAYSAILYSAIVSVSYTHLRAHET